MGPGISTLLTLEDGYRSGQMTMAFEDGKSLMQNFTYPSTEVHLNKAATGKQPSLWMRKFANGHCNHLCQKAATLFQ